MGWFSAIIKEWKSYIGVGYPKPTEELRFSEARMHCCLKVVSWTLVVFSFISYVGVAIALLWIKCTSASLASTKFGFIVQVSLFIFAIVFLFVIIPLISIRTKLERNIQRGEKIEKLFGGADVSDKTPKEVTALKEEIDKDFPRKTFWDAFPFASLVFFLIAVFMLFEIAYGKPSDTPEELLLALALYLVAAIVTSIVVLFGAHLVRFEGAVTELTKNANDASQKADKAASVTEVAASEIKEVNKSTKTIIDRASQFIDSASKIDCHLRETASTAGLTNLALRSDASYRELAQKFENENFIDRYIAARSCQGLMSDDAICLNADQTELQDGLFPSTRNMISSFLEEMAWDLGERCLVTNARNYTNFLVGAARGFEEYIKATRESKVELDARKAKKWRVFYLTHTLISPAQLLNWPEPLSKIDCSLCRIHPFMFDYMTYCRYFASKGDDTFIHSRLIRTTPDPVARTEMARCPERFDRRALSSADCDEYKLPQLCNRWGIPVWASLAITHKKKIVDKLGLYKGEKRLVVPSRDIIQNEAHQQYPFLFCYVPDDSNHWAITWDDNAPPSLFWPLYLKESSTNEKIGGQVQNAAGGEPDFNTLGNSLFDFLVNPSNNTSLLTHYPVTNHFSKQKNTLLQKEIKLFQDKLTEARTTWKKGEELSLNIAGDILLAFEHFAGNRWGFHGRSETEGSIKALDRWEDVQTATMLLVNVLLSQEDAKDQSESQDGMMDFFEWFGETFHSNRELGLYYFADNQDIITQMEDSNIPDEEFALIGVIELPEEESGNMKDFIQTALGKWIEGEKGGIKKIMGLRSSIQVPWKHAEVSWYLPCEQGKEELKRLAKFYQVAMGKSKIIGQE